MNDNCLSILYIDGARRRYRGASEFDQSFLHVICPTNGVFQKEVKERLIDSMFGYACVMI